ncbi:MAG: Fic family protein [Myxococcota bacterium]
MYVWERADWPRFRWSDAALLPVVGEARRRQGRLLGVLDGVGFALRQQAAVGSVVEDVVQSSEIEGEHLDRAAVRSSVVRRLGVDDAGLGPVDRRTDAVVAMALDAVAQLDAPLTVARLTGWQAFPTGYTGPVRVRTGGWREDTDGPMQVVSGPVGRPRVHYQAPPADRVDAEMARFLRWFATDDGTEGLLRAGLAHLWFVTIHPFEDGNGRLARAISDRALAQDERSEQRFYSLSARIRQERAEYYRVLEYTQRGELDVTDWLRWFVGCVDRAVTDATATVGSVIRRTAFWGRFGASLSERQQKVLGRVLDDGFDGKLTAKRYAQLGGCSIATAQRDLNELVDRGVVAREPGGSKNTRYTVSAEQPSSR